LYEMKTMAFNLLCSSRFLFFVWIWKDHGLVVIYFAEKQQTNYIVQ